MPTSNPTEKHGQYFYGTLTKSWVLINGQYAHLFRDVLKQRNAKVNP